MFIKNIRFLLLIALFVMIGIIVSAITASAQTYFSDNFDNPNESQKKWVDIYGQWEFKNKEYHQLMNAVNCMSIIADDYWNDDWNDYTFEVKGN